MNERISPTVGRRCALVGYIGIRDPYFTRKTPRGRILSRHKGNYTVQLEKVDEYVINWCRRHGYKMSPDGRVQGGPGRIRIIDRLKEMKSWK